MAKLNREGRLRDKRAEKQARKAARKLSEADDAAEAGLRSEELGATLAELDGSGPDGAEPESAAATSTQAG